MTIRILCGVAVLGTAALVLAGCSFAVEPASTSEPIAAPSTASAPVPSPSATPGPRFTASDDGQVTLPLSTAPARGFMMAQIHGAVGVNDEGCVTVKRAVLVASYGSTISADGTSITVPLVGTVKIGESLPKTAGGSSRLIEKYAKKYDKKSALELIARCGEGNYTWINPTED